MKWVAEELFPQAQTSFLFILLMLIFSVSQASIEWRGGIHFSQVFARGDEIFSFYINNFNLDFHQQQRQYNSKRNAGQGSQIYNKPKSVFHKNDLITKCAWKACVTHHN